MAHYARVIDGFVTDVIVADAEFINILPDRDNWIQCSYNTRGNVHYAPNSDTPDDGVALRGNFPSVGSVYDLTHDVFYTSNPPNDRNGFPANSWTLSTTTWLWTPPIPEPTDAHYMWDEPTQSWQKVPWWPEDGIWR